MDFDFSEEQKMFKEAIRDFAQKEVAPIVKEAEEKETAPVDLFSKLGKLGYLCPAYPPQYGGGGLGKIGDCILVEELARVCSGITSGIMVQSGLSTFPILAHGTKEQKQEFLIPATRGEKIAAYGLTEPNAGSDAAAVETTAKRDGNYYIVNGSKIYITNGQICDFVTIAASTDKSKGSRGISTIIVDKSTSGFTVNKMKKLGHHSAATGELAFDNCHVPVDNLIGEEGKGYRYMLEALNGARISHSARSLGTAQAAFDASLNYAKQRIQFGQPIGKFQAISFKLARMAAEIEAARWLLYRVAWLYDQGNECRKEAPMTKVFSSEMAIRTAEEAMRIHAGAGYLAESTIDRYFRDAILFHTTEGTTEIQELVIARELGL
ncbi:MAG: acyl-CoA dehydrogenase [Dehalococcoidia bacterium]|nr:MAG: acyl-CoA dehydrogenase [Dehalococcoidia bacterium]